MRLSKKMVSLICIPLMLMISLVKSTNGIEDNSNLSSIEIIDEGANTVIKSEEEHIIEESKNDEGDDLEVDNYSTYEELDSFIKEEEEVKVDVNYKREDITMVSGISKEELKQVFQNYNGAHTMEHLVDAFVDAEAEYGVNAFAMAGIVALESGFATSRRAVEDNNLTGYEVYSDDSKGRLFDSQYESIMQTARHLSKNYLTQGASYYNGVSIDAVQVNYCPDEKHNWHDKVDMLASGFLKVYNQIYQ